MRPTPRRIILYIIIFIVVLVVLALPIWLGLGPVVHSEAGLTAGISNPPPGTTQRCLNSGFGERIGNSRRTRSHVLLALGAAGPARHRATPRLYQLGSLARARLMIDQGAGQIGRV